MVKTSDMQSRLRSFVRPEAKEAVKNIVIKIIFIKKRIQGKLDIFSGQRTNERTKVFTNGYRPNYGTIMHYNQGTNDAQSQEAASGRGPPSPGELPGRGPADMPPGQNKQSEATNKGTAGGTPST
ncbi:uncharacterized protein LOC126882324 isoform X1 [Diabrotica virgifera virgifera]|uniref:Uncharacterized protein n=1 Tax=Diabrotica virgifera virgifera TaxID=50390 RepID=A0ABM5JYZ5_DIAVI|nr:uncharacterized protein LOC126882324 isoform X1 [Diabrotica virgifera virgifera]